jgi:hypothetical protein
MRATSHEFSSSTRQKPQIWQKDLWRLPSPLAWSDSIPGCRRKPR